MCIKSAVSGTDLGTMETSVNKTERPSSPKKSLPFWVLHSRDPGV